MRSAAEVKDIIVGLGPSNKPRSGGSLSRLIVMISYNRNALLGTWYYTHIPVAEEEVKKLYH